MPYRATVPAVLRDTFTAHPEAVGETYLEHLAQAGRFGVCLVAAGLACLLHAFLPVVFPHRASDTVEALHDQLSNRRATGDAET